jgi:mannosylglycoprotein endo-beta-mannosidase
MIKAKWGTFIPSQGSFFDAIGFWHHQIGLLRRYLKGWGANLHRDLRFEKDSILQQIQELDLVADGIGLNDEGWMRRYHLEETLVNLYQKEEDYWRQRSRIKWTVQGDANTTYFHAIANGRRRKCAITTLSTPSGPISDQQDIQAHVYAFYRELMGTDEPQLLTLVNDQWDVGSRVSSEENEAFALFFSQQELDEVLAQTKIDTAPGPDGFPVAFFKSFWPMLKHLILRILNDFALGRLDISRLNFAVITLLPKVSGADSIKLFRPIALINVIFKFISKAFAIRLTPIAHRVISPTQTAFI